MRGAQDRTPGGQGRGRERRNWVAMATATACAVAVVAVAGAGTAAADEPFDDPIAVHSMLQLNDPPSFMGAMFAEAANMDASAIRLDVAPALVFTDPSQPPDFSGLDRVMAFSRRYGLPVVADLVTIPPWISTCQTPAAAWDPARCGTDDLAAYRALITQIVSHADPVIRDWEIWNEPDTSQSFTGTPEQYAQMLRAAHDAIKQVDPSDNVLLGGISSTAGTSWLEQVFETPGADAAEAFDIANVHVRVPLDSVAPDIEWWKGVFSSHGFDGPLWVTEHGYPSDPSFQYDPAYSDGASSQANYLTASIPSMLDAGADKVFVTERDNLDGAFASEGLLGGEVSDPPVADPAFFEKPSYGAVRSLAECYMALTRDCPGPAPTATPGSLTIPATQLGHASVIKVSVTDPGAGPLQLGQPAVAGGPATRPSVQYSSCTGEVLEPNQTCTISLRFAPTRGGNVTAALELPSDDGALVVPARAVAPSVSSLTSPQLAHPRFEPIRGRSRAGLQQLSLVLTNPLTAPVRVARATVSGHDARRFEITSDRCAHFRLGPRARCHLVVRFSPARAGRARAALVLTGEGRPLGLALRPFAPALRRPLGATH